MVWTVWGKHLVQYKPSQQTLNWTHTWFGNDYSNITPLRILPAQTDVALVTVFAWLTFPGNAEAAVIPGNNGRSKEQQEKLHWNMLNSLSLFPFNKIMCRKLIQTKLSKMGNKTISTPTTDLLSYLIIGRNLMTGGLQHSPTGFIAKIIPLCRTWVGVCTFGSASTLARDVL